MDDSFIPNLGFHLQRLPNGSCIGFAKVFRIPQFLVLAMYLLYFNFSFLCYYILGAVPVVTRNLQQPSTPLSIYMDKSVEIPDAWHHQMVHGVSPGGVYMTNPVECVLFHELIPQLTTPSVLLVRRYDITSRNTPKTDLRRLDRNPDPRWNELNVLGEFFSGLVYL